MRICIVYVHVTRYFEVRAQGRRRVVHTLERFQTLTQNNTAPRRDPGRSAGAAGCGGAGCGRHTAHIVLYVSAALARNRSRQALTRTRQRQEALHLLSERPTRRGCFKGWRLEPRLPEACHPLGPLLLSPPLAAPPARPPRSAARQGTRGARSSAAPFAPGQKGGGE